MQGKFSFWIRVSPVTFKVHRAPTTKSLISPNKRLSQNGPNLKCKIFYFGIHNQIANIWTCNVPLGLLKLTTVWLFSLDSTNSKVNHFSQTKALLKMTQSQMQIFYQGIDRNHQIINIWTFSMPAGLLKWQQFVVFHCTF